ncbi:MAG: dihydroorotate dehydrogenase electron transfer subunit [Candidatus Desulfacyla sp.]
MIEQDTEIVFNKRVAAGACLIGLRSPEIAAEAGPGQFVMVRVGRDMDPLLRRPFSICGVLDDLVLVLYRVVGRGTRILSDAREGELLQVLGPLGKGFVPPKAGRHAILAAGGMGLAPLLFLSRAMAPETYTFFAGFGSADQVVGADELGFSGMEMRISTDDGSAGHHGLVTELLEKGPAGLSGDGGMVFSCGPLPMLKAVAAITHERAVPCQVSLEAAMACGLGACQGCAVKAAPGKDRAYWHVCQDGPVFDATDVDWGAL